MNPDRLAATLQLLGIGWYVAVCIGGGALGGWWLDGKTGLSPLFTLAGLGLGIAVAGVGMVKMLAAATAPKPKRNSESRENGGSAENSGGDKN